MQTIRISDILVPENRQRRDFDPKGLVELSNSILGRGLFHPIVLRDDGKTLVSGERRMRALSTNFTTYYHNNETIDPGYIPFTKLSDLTPLQLREAELEENTVRIDLTWQERDKAIAQLHELRVDQAAEAGTSHTKAQTVAELLGRPGSSGDATAIVSNALLIAKHLDDPAIAGAKSQKEALNLVKKKITTEYNAALADSIKAAGIVSPHTLMWGDARTLLPALPDGVFDVICVDPPYGIDADKFKPMSGSEAGTIHEYEDTMEYAAYVWDAIFREGARICKPQAHLYMFFDFRHWMRLKHMAADLGWDVWPRPLIWHKPSGGMLGDSSHGPRMAYEPILFASRGKKKVTGVYLDVISENPAAELHAAEKPLALIVNLLRRSCTPGDRVLDPCCGSGTIFPAAQALSLFATGIESVERHYNTALVRLNKGKEG